MEVIRPKGETSEDVGTVRVDSDSGHPQLRRFDILSDPRLSQLFELSAHMEAVASTAKGSGNELKVQSPWSEVDICGGDGGSVVGQDCKTTSKFNRYETPNANHRITASRSSNGNLEIKVSLKHPSTMSNVLQRQAASPALSKSVLPMIKCPFSIFFLSCRLSRLTLPSPPRVSTSSCRPPLAGTQLGRNGQIRRRQRSRRRSQPRGRR